MAICKNCQASGWFLGVNKDGLCGECEVVHEMETISGLRVIEESIEIARTTKKLDTMFSRLGVAEEKCRDFLKFEKRGIPSILPKPSELIRIIDQARQELTIKWIEQELTIAQRKSGAATTPAAKTRPYSKLLEAIGGIYAALESTKEVEKAEIRIRQEMDTVRLKGEIERADKLAFKRQKKRACDAYIDALFLLRHDSTPDEKQEAYIAKIESKIRDLGGEVPSE